MQEISNYLHNFDIHRESYVEIEGALTVCYQGYVNSKTIITLFEYWLFSINSIFCSYGTIGLDKFLLSRCKDPISFSYLYEFGLEEEIKDKSHLTRNFIVKFDKYFPLNYRLPGAPAIGFSTTLRCRYTKLLTLQLLLDFDKSLAEKITDIACLYLFYLGIEIDKSKVRQSLPNIFTSKQIKCKNLNETRLDCAPIEIMQFKGFEYIILLNRIINIHGYQHGGGYDIVQNDPLTYFEKKISNRFYGWGFSQDNVYQTKYKADQNIYENTKRNNKVIWIESSRDSKLTAYHYPCAFDTKKDFEIPKYIYYELKKYGKKYYNKPYPGVLMSSRYKNFRGVIIPSNQSAEKILAPSDIAIFDNCWHTLIYYCLENNILFLIVDKRDVVQYYTHKMLLWYQLLRKNNLLFHNDECGLLSKRIKEFDYCRKLPKQVYKYYKNMFN